MKNIGMSRRGFIAGGSVLAAAGLTALGGCAPAPQADSEALSATGTASSDAPAWLGAAPEIAEDEIVETADCDVLVVGCGGTSGTFAMCSAAENGAKVIAVEQYAEGNGSGIRDDIGCVRTKLIEREGAEIDEELLVRCLQHTSGFFQDPRVVTTWLEESGETFDWYAEKCEAAGFLPGLRKAAPPKDEQYTPFGIPSFSTCHHVTWNLDGGSLDNVGPTNNRGAEVLTQVARDLGVDVRFDTKMVKLLGDASRVTGAICQTEDGYVQINAAKGVILCTGGYSMNPDMMEALQEDTVLVAPKITTSMPGATGDGIKAGLWIGAKMDPCAASSCAGEEIFPAGVALEDAPATEMGFSFFGPMPFLRVNSEGERFCNEDDLFDSVSHELIYQKEPYYITVFDGNWQQYYQDFNIYHAYRCVPYDNGELPLFGTAEETAMSLEQSVADGFTVKADTLEELADILQIPVDTFVAQVERYNKMCEGGKDTDFFKPAFRLNPVNTPPYYAERILQDVYHTMDGLVINKDCQVIADGTNEPIPGLYAAGDCSGCFLGATYLGTAAGIAAGRSITFGRHAGRMAAQA